MPVALALTDFVKAQPFSDFIPQRGSLILCKALYYCKVAPDVRGRRKGEWGMVIMKNIISLCAKFHIDREAWPGDPIARERIAQPCRIITGPKNKRKACEQPEVASIWRTYGFTKTPSMTNATLAGYLPPTFLFPGCICRTKQTVLSLCLI